MSDFENLDYYELLGISRSALPEEIKRAYRREISKYHPDRFVNATPAEQQYASLRSQRLTEAYGVLSEFGARSDYNRSQGARVGRPARPATPPPPHQRDHQAELYEQANAHLQAGRLLQAVGALRQLQQINPFYRDSAELLASAEAQLNRRSEKSPRRPRPLLLIGGVIGGLAIVGLAAWALAGRGATAGQPAGSTGAPVAAVTSAPTRAPEPTFTPASPTAPVVAAAATAPPTEAPTAAPTEAPTTAPTEAPTPPPTEPPTPPPTEAPTAPPVVAEQGRLLYADSFSNAGWADLRGAIWQVGYRGGRYRVQADAGVGPIWSYRVAPVKDGSFGVNVQVTSGEGGLMLRFLDENNYLSVTLNPAETSFRVEQHSRGAINVIAGGQSEAIVAGAKASNRLVARLTGDHIQVLVNGQQVADANAQGLPDSARYGLLVIAKDTDSEAFFDNLQIREP